MAITVPRRARSLRGDLTIVALLLAVPVFAYLLLLWRLHRHPIVVSQNYSAPINAQILTTPPDKRAWPLYHEALKDLDLPDDFHFFHPAAKREWPRLLACLKRNQSALVKIRAASKLPHVGYALADQVTADELELQRSRQSRRGIAPPRPVVEPPSPNPLLVSTLLPQLGYCRQMTQLLRANGWRALAEGDHQRACDNILARIRIAEHAREVPMLICDQVSHSIVDTVCSDLAEMIADRSHQFTDPELAAIAELLSQYEPTCRLQLERDSLLDVVQRTFTDDGDGDGLFNPLNPAVRELVGGSRSLQDRLMDPIKSLKIASRREHVRCIEEAARVAEAEFQVPLWKSTTLTFYEPFETLRQRGRQIAPIGAVVSLTYWPYAYVYRERIKLHRDATLAAIALERFRLAKGTWPERLEQLVPEFLAELPIDRFDGQPLRYRLIKGKPLLYSVGSNQRDDGGYPFGTDEFNLETMQDFATPSWWDGNGPSTLPGDLVFLPPPPPREPLEPPEESDVPEPESPSNDG